VELEEVGEVPLKIAVKEVEDEQDCRQGKDEKGHQNGNGRVHNSKAPSNLNLLGAGKMAENPAPAPGGKERFGTPRPADMGIGGHGHGPA